MGKDLDSDAGIHCFVFRDSVYADEHKSAETGSSAFDGSDYRHMVEVSGVIRDLAEQGHMILVVSHDREFMEMSCDRVLETQQERGIQMDIHFPMGEKNAKLVENDGCSVYQLRNESGEGTITIYEVFPGVALSYNDFHMRYYDSGFRPERGIFCIDHCREGRLEYPAAEDAYSYVGAGDLKLDRRLSHIGRFEMPLSHYHGATVSFDMDIACRSLPLEMKDFPVDLKEIQKKFCSGIYPCVIHGACSIEHIFGELYAVPEKIKRPYFKVKILELLLYLEALELPENKTSWSVDRPYFYKTQVEKTKAVGQFITQHMDENFTQEELSHRFDIPLTTMKKCFKSVFGATIGNYLLEYRMNQAAVLLKTKRDMSVAEISGCVGYDSPSKFAIVFRKVMGMSPTEYRNHKEQI